VPSAELARGDTELLPEVTGELVWSQVTVRGYEVLDGGVGHGWVQEAAVAFAQAQLFD
jgi:hypothetical protein